MKGTRHSDGTLEGNTEMVNSAINASSEQRKTVFRAFQQMCKFAG